MVVLHQKDSVNHSTRKRKPGWLCDWLNICKSLPSCAHIRGFSGRARAGWASVCSPATTWRQKCWAGTSQSLSRGTFLHILLCKSYAQGSTLNTCVLPLLHTSQLIILRAIYPAMHYCTSRTAPASPDLCPAEFLGTDLGFVMPNQSAAGVLLIS